MEYIYSNIDKNKLLHLVNRFEEINERTNIAPENQFLQLASLKMPNGKTFKEHKHIWKKINYEKTIAQESWVVIQGTVKVHFYDIDGTFLKDDILQKGDCSMTFEGGHNYTILEDNTVVYEFKTGPYTGIENDKEFL